MKRTAFAGLCGISKMMVSKYEAAGLVVVVDNDVDAEQSLTNLEGRLDEEKRLRALAVLREAGVTRSDQNSGALPTSRATSAKTQKDEIERDLKRLEYGQKAAELVHVADVAEAARQAVAIMRETFSNSRRLIAKNLCVRFDLPADKETTLVRVLGEEFELALGRFGEACAALAKEPLNGPTPAPRPATDGTDELPL